MKSNSKGIIAILLVLAAISIGLYFLLGKSGGEFKVLFDSDGGSQVTEQVVKKGDKVTKPQDPTRENYQFVEWQLDGATYNFDNEVTKDITLKATWKEIVMHSIKVTLDGNDYSADVVDGEMITIEKLNIPNKEGYKVVFYNENNEEFDTTTPIVSDMVLTGKYVELKKYTVKFNSNGGSKVSDMVVIEGNTISEPDVTRSGYALEGWYDGEEKFDFTNPITKDMTLTAKWSNGTTISVKFTVDGNVYKTVSVSENTKVSKPTNPTKKGYKFVEWQLNGEKFDFNTKITSEITLTALFEESKTVTVTFDSDGGSKVASQEVEVDSKAKAPTNPTKNGYKFVEWQLNGKKYDFNTKVTKDIKLKAIWVKTYTVSFKVDGKEISNQKVVEGEKAIKPQDPTKSGHKFVAWLLNNQKYDFNTKVTKDISLTASFEKNTSPTVAPTTKPSVTPTPTVKPTATPTAAPTPTPVVTYTLEWKAVSGSVVEQYQLFIKSSTGSYVSGRARLYLATGAYEDTNIPASGTSRYYPKGVYDKNQSYVISVN